MKDKEFMVAERPLLVAPPTTSFSRFFPGSVSAKLTFPEQSHNTSFHQNLFTLLPNYHQSLTSTRTEFDNQILQLNEMNESCNKENNQKESSDETHCKYLARKLI